MTPPPRWRDVKWDALAAVIAALVGLLALVVSAYTAHLQRQQVRAQVWPRLGIGRSMDRHLVIKNVGLGPARVRGVRVAVDGRAVKSWAEFLPALGLPPGPHGHSTIRGRVLAPGEVVEAWSAHDDDAGRALFQEAFVKNAARLEIVVCYCSVLDQCWLAGGKFVGADDIDPDREIGACPIPPAQRFTD